MPVFEAIIQAHPDHPAGYIYMGNAIWLNYLADLAQAANECLQQKRCISLILDKEDKADAKVDAEFRKNMNKGVELAEAKLEKNPNDLQAMYYPRSRKKYFGRI